MFFYLLSIAHSPSKTAIRLNMAIARIEPVVRRRFKRSTAVKSMLKADSVSSKVFDSEASRKTGGCVTEVGFSSRRYEIACKDPAPKKKRSRAQCPAGHKGFAKKTTHTHTHRAHTEHKRISRLVEMRSKPVKTSTQSVFAALRVFIAYCMSNISVLL